MQNNITGKTNGSFRVRICTLLKTGRSPYAVRCVYTEKRKNKDKKRMWLEKPPLSAENIVHKSELINKARNLFIAFLANH